jgi:type II secretory pathway pseudopilin PulG
MRTRRAGQSLIELVFTASILAVLLGLAAPPARLTLDTAAVRAARDALAGRLAVTRAAAIARGGATLEVHAATGMVRIRDAQGRQVGDDLDLAGYRVDIGTGAAHDPVLIRFDALGIGRMAGRTFVITRGRAEARLTVSAYGRWRTS